jgi:oxygen-independent coproporphyrinogen-3 oxidase
MPLGIYAAVPFCKSKCSYCNFASGVGSRAMYGQYVERVCADMVAAEATARAMGGQFERGVDSIYLGGGTPTILAGEDLARLFQALRENFDVDPQAEVTVECAPGTLTQEMLDTLLACGVNRISLGVQSFVDQEAAAVGRLHTRAKVLDDIARLREAGIININVDLIAGLPHQSEASWKYSVEETIATGAPHVSVYMLEVDEDSRLGRELIAGGTKYHAHFVPNDDLTADLYVTACEKLEAAGIVQYEISNFAAADSSSRRGRAGAPVPTQAPPARTQGKLVRTQGKPGCESRHNLKYWERHPYLGFGVDAHSMLRAGDGAVTSAGSGVSAVRFSTADDLNAFLARTTLARTEVTQQAALEETFFLGLRLVRGVDLDQVVHDFGREVVEELSGTIEELASTGLLAREGSVIRLTQRGRLLSNEVFQRFLFARERQKT